MDSLFENIAGKLKGFAKIIFLLGVVIWFFAAVGVGVGEDNPFLLLIIIIGSPLSSWIISAILYGFGELIEKVTHLEKHFCPEADRQTDKEHNCPWCYEKVPFKAEKCEKCGRNINWDDVK